MFFRKILNNKNSAGTVENTGGDLNQTSFEKHKSGKPEAHLSLANGQFTGLQKKEAVTIVNKVATYARVSSHDQKTKGDLDRQSSRLSEYCAKKELNVSNIIKDVGSGLSDNRKGFLKLSSLVIEKKIDKIVIEYKDRLTRFQYNFIEKMFNSYGVEIICIETKEISDEDDLVGDMMALIASFSGRLYGRRSAKRRKKDSK